ncbi:MAG TPA: Hsp20/alpha crystallin family protein [Bacteroidales bacterium]|nr:Hsp20/alpha crystallin family protein [Bacteroidales bacterium]
MKWTNDPVLNQMMNGMHRKPYYGTCNYNRPAANIIDNEKDFTIELAVPGMQKDDFKIKLEDDILTISAELIEKEEKTEKESVNFTRREFRYDGFSRSFSLPENINQDKIKADYKNGVLSILLPKSEEARIKGREIKIS